MKTVIIKVEIEDDESVENILALSVIDNIECVYEDLDITETCETCKYNRGGDWTNKIECYTTSQIVPKSHYCGYWEARS